MKQYHKVTRADCLSVATKEEALHLSVIKDMPLLKQLAQRWCTLNNYTLYGYLGTQEKAGECWDAVGGDTRQ